MQSELSDAQRARAERQRLRARELRAARLAAAVQVPLKSITRLVDSGGGFLAEPAEETRVALPPDAPPSDPSLWPNCVHCERRFATSYLLETFDYHACDLCRDDSDRHALMTRTEAKDQYLLQDCDLDSRPPPLRCLRRRNPHGRADMRLYVRAAVEERAILVHGSSENLEKAREAREEKRAKVRASRYTKELRALRMTVRGSHKRADTHHHVWGEETYCSEDDVYTKTCQCGAQQTYEKM